MERLEERELQEDWVWVDLGRPRPTESENSEKIRAEEEEIQSVSSMKTYYISPGICGQPSPDDLLGIIWPKIMSIRPQAVLVISPSWQTPKPAVCVASRSTGAGPDFNDFPSKNHQMTYTAPRLARRVRELLLEAGVMQIEEEDTARGLHHVPLIPLYFVHPNADIPVCRLSIQSTKDGIYYYNLGRALSPLKDEGVLLVGAGASTDNFGHLNLQVENRPPDLAQAFDSWVDDCMRNNRFEEVIWFENSCSVVAGKAHPLPEQMCALLAVLGAAGEGVKAQHAVNGWMFG